MAFFWMLKARHLGIQKDTNVRVLDFDWPQLRRQRWENRPYTDPRFVTEAPSMPAPIEYTLDRPANYSIQRDETTRWELRATFDPYENAVYVELTIVGNR